MKLIVNGEPVDSGATTLAALLAELGYEDAWYATAVNGEFVAVGERETTAIESGYRIEVLTPRQGG